MISAVNEESPCLTTKYTRQKLDGQRSDSGQSRSVLLLLDSKSLQDHPQMFVKEKEFAAPIQPLTFTRPASDKKEQELVKATKNLARALATDTSSGFESRVLD